MISYKLTTDHPSSRNGQPVFVTERGAFGPEDVVMHTYLDEPVTAEDIVGGDPVRNLWPEGRRRNGQAVPQQFAAVEQGRHASQCRQGGVGGWRNEPDVGGRDPKDLGMTDWETDKRDFREALASSAPSRTVSGATRPIGSLRSAVGGRDVGDRPLDAGALSPHAHCARSRGAYNERSCFEI